MKKKVIILFLALLLTVQAAAALVEKMPAPSARGSAEEVPDTIENFEFTKENLDEIRAEWNSNVEAITEKVPSFLLGMIADQRIELIIGNVSVAIVMEDGLMKDAVLGSLERPTLRIETDNATFDDLMNTDEPLAELDKAIGEGRFRYHTLTIRNKVGFFLLRAVAKIFG